MNTLNVGKQAKEPVQIETPEQATYYVEALVSDMKHWRQRCDASTDITLQRRALWTFLTKQGQVIGALNALKMCGLLSDRAYKELHQQAVNSLIPTEIKAP